jgi:multicomponent Na+:H+ antiporter subunit A
VIFVLAANAGVAVACALLGKRLERKVFLVGALAPASALVWLLTAISAPTDEVTTTIEWVPELGLQLGFRLDGLGTLMVALIGGIGVLVFLYAWRYFGDREGLGRFSAYLVVFAGSMFGLVVADNLLLLFIFWELTSVMSYLLIGFEDESVAARAGALQALLVTAAGGLAMLGGLVLMAQAGDSYSLSTLLDSPPTTTSALVGLGLVLIGAFTKSAQFPFHFWLPGAMSAPTPVSAYLHSATMVKAGIYLIARLAPVYAALAVWWQPTLVTVGLVTMFVGGWRALAQRDVKLLLAQGTVSQLGFIVVLVGVGIPELTFAGMAMILAHAVFKGALFMVAGIIDHQAHTRDIRLLSGLGGATPGTFGTAIVATASMVGIPALLGFVSKEAALEGLVHEHLWWITAGVVVGSALTMAYGLRFLSGAFLRKPDHDTNEDLIGPEVSPPRFSFLFAPLVLVLLTVVAGVAPAIVDGLVVAAAGAVSPAADAYHLAAWHGFGIPLALSATALIAGWVIWRRPLGGLRRLTTRVPDATDVYSRVLAGVNRLADRSTSLLQGGSLPVYVGVILIVTVTAPGVLMIQNWQPLSGLTFAESPIQAATAAIVIVAALATIIAKRRMAAVLFLGAVGYGVAVLFVVQGAPDLALTQLLIETLVLTLFILVLRVLPQRFGALQSRIRRITRIAISVTVGVFAGAFALWAAIPQHTTLIDDYISRSEPEAGGSNVVNVILTDFRALDTLGEITVLAVAALGVVMLVKAPLRRDDGEELEAQAVSIEPPDLDRER